MTSAVLAGSLAISDALSHAAETLRRSTVRIFDGPAAIGSGVIWSDSGVIVTNAHVVRARHVIVEDSTGRRHIAHLRARSNARDLATLQVEASGLTAIEKAVANAVRPGDLVLALGNPFGVRGVVVAGVVHAVGAVERFPNQPWIQADIRLAPGNSGGPLADARARLVGINSLIAGGVGLAVPIAAVERFLRGES